MATFPIDLRPILINYTLDTHSSPIFNINGDIPNFESDTLHVLLPGSGHTSVEIAIDHLLMIPEITSTGALSYRFLADDPSASDEDRSYIIMNGHRYNCVGHMGGGSYGKVARVKGENGVDYALKRQLSINPPPPIPARKYTNYVKNIREGILHYLVHSQNTACKYTTKLYSILMSINTDPIKLPMPLRNSIKEFPAGTTIMEEGIFCYHLTELMDGSLGKMLEELPIEYTSIEVTKCLSHISQALSDLWTSCRFNHKDLKPDNILYKQSAGTRTYYLTDFGFSSMDLMDENRQTLTFRIEPRSYLLNSFSSRDITQLSWYLFTLHANVLSNELRSRLFYFFRLPPALPLRIPGRFEWTHTYTWINEASNNSELRSLDSFINMLKYMSHTDKAVPYWYERSPCEPDPPKPNALARGGTRNKRGPAYNRKKKINNKNRA